MLLTTPTSRSSRDGLLCLLLLGLGSCGGEGGGPTLFEPDPVRLAGVSPLSAAVGSGALEIEVHGSGFQPGVTVTLGATTLSATVESAYLLRATVPASLVATAGQLTLQVNVGSHGASNGALSFWVLNRLPTVVAVEPDSILASTPSQISVSGSDFAPGAVVWVGDKAFPTTRVDATELRATLPALDSEASRSLRVRVVNPPPGGGSSTDMVHLHVYEALDLTGADPRTVSKGSGPHTLTIYGTGFTPDASVEVGGVPRPTTVLDDRRVSVTIEASETAAVGALEYVVTTAHGTTLPGWLTIMSGSQALTSSLAIERPTRGLVWDESRSLFYATARSNAEVFAIDPNDGSESWSIELPEEAGPIALSDDGSFLYVSYIGSPGLLRIDVETRSIDLELGLDGFPISYGSPGNLRVGEVVTIPGSPEEVLAVVHNVCCSPSEEGISWFQGAARMDLQVRGSGITFMSADTLFLSVYSDAVRYALAGNQLEFVDALRPAPPGRLAYAAGYLFSSIGARADARDGAIRATGPLDGSMSVDVANGRIHYFDPDDAVLRTAHMLSMEEIGRIDLPYAWTNRDVVRWGPDGLAFGNGGQYILFIRSPLIGEP